MSVPQWVSSACPRATVRQDQKYWSGGYKLYTICLHTTIEEFHHHSLHLTIWPNWPSRLVSEIEEWTKIKRELETYWSMSMSSLIWRVVLCRWLSAWHQGTRGPSQQPQLARLLPQQERMLVVVPNESGTQDQDGRLICDWILNLLILG